MALGGTAAVTSRRAELIAPVEALECVSLHPLDEPDRLRDLLAEPEQVVVNVIGAWLRDAKRAIADTTRCVLDALPNTARYVHVSATSVYGHRPGECLNEDSDVSGAFEIGRIHASTDLEVLARRNSVVLRVPHLYGPNRERSLRRMFDGDFPVVGTGENVMHHLHIEDFANAVVAAAQSSYVGVLNVVDDDSVVTIRCKNGLTEIRLEAT